MMLDDGNGVFRLWANCIFPEVGLEVMFRKSVKTNANIAGFIVDPKVECEPVDFTPNVFLRGKVPNKANCQAVLDPSPFRCGDPGTQHPGLSFLTSVFL